LYFRLKAPGISESCNLELSRSCLINPEHRFMRTLLPKRLCVDIRVPPPVLAFLALYNLPMTKKAVEDAAKTLTKKAVEDAAV